MLVLANLQKQIEFLGEERVVVLQPEAEERKRFDGRAAADDHFRASLRQQIERGELLKYAYRVCGTQNGDSAGETDPVRRRAVGHGRLDDRPQSRSCRWKSRPQSSPLVRDAISR